MFLIGLFVASSRDGWYRNFTALCAGTEGPQLDKCKYVSPSSDTAERFQGLVRGDLVHIDDYP